MQFLPIGPYDLNHVHDLSLIASLISVRCLWCSGALDRGGGTPSIGLDRVFLSNHSLNPFHPSWLVAVLPSLVINAVSP
jgi:hypothetical protein